jgi:hypothetical protein
MVTDSQRFIFIFLFAAILIGGAFALYMTGTDAGKAKKISKEKEAYENQEYGFGLVYPKEFKVVTTSPESEDEAAPLHLEFSEDAENSPVVLSIHVEPKRQVTTCAELKGRVEGTITIGTGQYQPCRVPASVAAESEGMRIETTHGSYTFGFSSDNYTLYTEAVQNILATVQFTK